MGPICRGVVIFFGLLAIVGAIVGIFSHYPPEYSVAIDSVSGLDQVTNLGRPALNPVFNLTLAFTSHLNVAQVCAEDGMYIEVAYGCVPLAATAPTAPDQLCARMGRQTVVPLVARGNGVTLPGYILDRLAADLRKGVPPVFEVTRRRNGGRTEVGSCAHRRLGDAAALRSECNRFWQDSWSTGYPFYSCPKPPTVVEVWFRSGSSPPLPLPAEMRIG